MNAEQTEPLLDLALLQLRIALANALTVTDAIRAFQPRGDRLVPILYTELRTLQRVLARSRRVLRRYIPPEGRGS
jgi:hypothetical protein